MVSAAHCTTRAALRAWAQPKGSAIAEPAPAEHMLAGGEARLTKVAPLGAADCVLPRLERCFQRHADGLDLCRWLLAWLLARLKAEPVCAPTPIFQ